MGSPDNGGGATCIPHTQHGGVIIKCYERNNFQPPPIIVGLGAPLVQIKIGVSDSNLEICLSVNDTPRWESFFLVASVFVHGHGGAQRKLNLDGENVFHFQSAFRKTESSFLTASITCSLRPKPLDIHTFISGKYSDATIMLDDESSFNIHRLVLAANSPVMQAIFDNEDKRTVHKVGDVSSETFQNFLIHCYQAQSTRAFSDECDKLDLLSFAHRMDCKILVEKCIIELEKTAEFSPETALRTFKIATTLGLRSLELMIATYIVENIVMIQNSTTWHGVTNDDLAKAIHITHSDMVKKRRVGS